jgi:hypothetical protein
MTVSIFIPRVAQGDLFFRYLDYFAALIAPAMRTGAVRKLGFVAIRALGAASDLQMIVGPACGGALLGVSAFRIWHISLFKGFGLFKCFGSL